MLLQRLRTSGPTIVAAALVMTLTTTAGAAPSDPPTTAPAESSEPDAVLVAPPPAPERTTEERAKLDHELSMIDPRRDGFDTELLNDNGGTALKHLAVGLTGPLPVEELETYVSPAYEGDDLRSLQASPAFASDGLEVYHGAPGTARYRGRSGLVDAMRELGSPFDGEEFHVKFKIVKITPLGPGEAETGVIYLALGTGEKGHIQQNANWTARWDVSAGYDHPRLLGITVHEFQENRAARLFYEDCTESVFDGRAIERIRRGIHGWWGKIDAGMGFSFYGDYAVVLGDVDNDGLDDMYMCQPGSLSNMLFRHNPDGTLTNISAQSGVDLLDDSPTALLVDLDNDGNQDLVVATLLSINFMRGDGTGRFQMAGLDDTDNAVSLSAADYDGDGRLDLYVCRYSTANRATVSGSSVYDSDDGKPNVLLRNEGDFAFRDVTLESGIDDNNHKFSFAGVWEDFDNDGDLDLYVANDFGRNNLYQNDGGRFHDVAAEAGVEDMAAGMGATWADYDLDGKIDLYVSNMFSSAGGRIVDKPQIASIAGDDAVQPLQRFAKGNTLFRNQGDGTFKDVSFEAGITMGRWSWGGEFLDFNNDCWPDIVVPNGFVSNHITKDL